MNANLKKAARDYRKTQIAALSPGRRLLLTYAIAREAANEGDAERLMRTLLLLRASLKFEQSPHTALTLLTIYQRCERAIREEEDFPRVAQMFTRMHGTLARALERADQAA